MSCRSPRLLSTAAHCARHSRNPRVAHGAHCAHCRSGTSCPKTKGSDDARCHHMHDMLRASITTAQKRWTRDVFIDSLPRPPVLTHHARMHASSLDATPSTQGAAETPLSPCAPSISHRHDGCHRLSVLVTIAHPRASVRLNQRPPVSSNSARIQLLRRPHAQPWWAHPAASDSLLMPLTQ